MTDHFGPGEPEQKNPPPQAQGTGLQAKVVISSLSQSQKNVINPLAEDKEVWDLVTAFPESNLIVKVVTLIVNLVFPGNFLVTSLRNWNYSIFICQRQDTFKNPAHYWTSAVLSRLVVYQFCMGTGLEYPYYMERKREGRIGKARSVRRRL